MKELTVKELDLMDDVWERSIATASLLSVVKGQGELDDEAVSLAAFHLYRDLQRLRDLEHKRRA